MAVYGIIGGTLWGNRGAEAMVVTTFGRVRDRDPDARLLLLSYQAKKDRELCTDPAVAVLDAAPLRLLLVHLPFAGLCWLAARLRVRLPGSLLPRDVRAMRDLRVLFDVSGISFHDGRLAVVAYNLLCLWPAILLGVPVVRLSQAMGPFRHPLNRLPARAMTARSLRTFARGRVTAQLLAGLDVPDDRWAVAADVAFSYRPEDRLTSENEDLVERCRRELAEVRASGREVVALVPSSLVLKKLEGEGRSYVELLEDLIAHLIGRGLHVLVLPNATSAGTDTLRNNDLAVIEQLKSATAAPPASFHDAAVSYVDFDLDTASIRSLLEHCQLTVTSRFHAMVASLALGVPTLVLGWSHKYEEVLEMFGCADDAVDFSADRQQVVDQLDEVLDGLEARRTRIAAALPDVLGSSARQFDVMDELGRS
jgi:colanic acid/amylovoran biosynthesis protein